MTVFNERITLLQIHNIVTDTKIIIVFSTVLSSCIFVCVI